MALALLGALGAAACGPTEADDAFARVAILETSADWREQAVGEFVDAADGQPLGVGDEVRTDGTGFAEIEYLDGSLTRLDVDTTFRVLTLSPDVVAPTIRVELDRGRIWNRIREVTGSVGGFEVETSLGVAAARGTAFWIACDGQVCRTSVTDGTVTFTLLDGTVLVVEAGEGIAIGAGGEEARGPIDPDLLEPDGWAGRNLLVDDGLDRFGTGREVCNASLAGQSLNRANTPDRAVVVDASHSGDVPAIVVAAGNVTSYDMDLRVGPLAVPAAEDSVHPPNRRFAAGIDVSAYAFVGVGLFEFTGVTTGTVCVLRAYVRVTGRNPLTTLLGALGVVLAVMGAIGLLVSALRARRDRREADAERRGHRWVGTVSGVACALGVALLLQQFAVLPLTTRLLGVTAVLGVLAGLAAGWPRSSRVDA